MTSCRAFQRRCGGRCRCPRLPGHCASLPHVYTSGSWWHGHMAAQPHQETQAWTVNKRHGDKEYVSILVYVNRMTTENGGPAIQAFEVKDGFLINNVMPKWWHNIFILSCPLSWMVTWWERTLRERGSLMIRMRRSNYHFPIYHASPFWAINFYEHWIQSPLEGTHSFQVFSEKSYEYKNKKLSWK